MRIAPVIAGAMLLSCASLATSGAQTTRPSDVAGDWEITFVVTARGDVTDSTRKPTLDSLVGRMRLHRFKAPPPDPQYKEQYVWPGWRGEVLAPFTSLLQVPPFSLRDEPGSRLVRPDSVRRKFRSSDSLAVDVWGDSAGVRFEMTASGCSDCGNIYGMGAWDSGIVVGRWNQEFYGIGDSGRWHMRRVDARTKESK